MKSFLTIAAIIAFIVLATVARPVVVEAGRRVTKSRTVERGSTSARSLRSDRAFASDCSGALRVERLYTVELRSANCAGQASDCSGAARASRRPSVQVIIH
jgi:hypothetical protein